MVMALTLSFLHPDVVVKITLKKRKENPSCHTIQRCSLSTPGTLQQQGHCTTFSRRKYTSVKVSCLAYVFLLCKDQVSHAYKTTDKIKGPF